MVLFLDDDGWYPDAGLAAHVAARFAADPELAVLSMQVVDPGGGPGPGGTCRGCGPGTRSAPRS